jgi:hypothetical protein
VAVKDGLALTIVWDSSIDDNVLPSTILEELEDCETVLDTVVDDQVVQELWVCALDQKGSQKPAVTKNTLLDVSWSHGVSVHLWLTLWSDFLRSFPLDHGHVHGVLWWVDGIVVKRAVVRGELRVSKKSVIVGTNLDDLLNLVLNWVLLGLLLLRHVLLSTVILHIVIFLTHAIFVTHLILLCSQYLLVLLLSNGLSILSNELLLAHLVLLLVYLLIISLLLIRSHLTQVNHLLLLHLLLHMELLHLLVRHLHLHLIGVHLHLVWVHLHLHLVLLHLHLLLFHHLLLLLWRELFFCGHAFILG